MANKEIVVNHDDIRNPQTITKVVSDAFKAQKVDIHKNDCVEIVDDNRARKRVYTVKNVKFFGPWSHRG